MGGWGHEQGPGVVSISIIDIMRSITAAVVDGGGVARASGQPSRQSDRSVGQS